MAAATGTAAGQSDGTTSGDGTSTGTAGGTTSGDGGGGDLPGSGQTTTVAVGPGGNFVFEPETAYVQPGETVVFEWESDFHNIVVENQPSAANWEGTPGGPSDTYDTGYTYEYTFTETGTYDYYCDPHRAQGMVAAIVVNESGEAPGGGEYQTILPDSAMTLGVAATGAMASVLGLAYFFMKYSGDYGELE